MEELKPCPHCGGNNQKVGVDDSLLGFIEEGSRSFHEYMETPRTYENWAVCCSFLNGGCGARGGVRRTKEEAIAAWNQRAEHTCEGCKYEHFKNEILCPGCARDKRDNYKPAKVVE